MKSKYAAIAGLCVLIVFFTSCKQSSSPLALHVPADASAVFVMNLESLAGKAASSGMSIDSLANVMSGANAPQSMNWNDVKDAGIELGKPVYAYFKQVTTVEQGLINHVAMLAQVDDDKKLEKFLRDKNAGKEIATGSDFRYIALENQYVAGWNKEVLIVAQATGGHTESATLTQQLMKDLFSLKKSSSIAEAKGFNELVQKQGDMHFYTTTSAAMLENVPAAASLQSLIKDSYTEGIINFENGKIVASTTTHYGKALQDILSKYPPKQINHEIVRNYPDTVTGFVLASFDPHIITDIVRHAGFESMIDGFSSNVGFSSKDVVDAFTGDIALLFTKSESVSGPWAVFARPSYLVSFKIADRVLFDKVMNGLIKTGLLTQTPTGYQLGRSGGQDFVIETHNNSLLIGSSNELLKAYTAGNAKNGLPQGVEKQVNDKQMALYIDLYSLVGEPATAKGDKAGANDSGQASMHSSTPLPFKDLIATVDKNEGNTTQSNMTLNFINSNENSLGTLVKMLADMKARQQERELQHTFVVPDSTESDNNN